MFNFNNKYLTYAALIFIVYLMYSHNTFQGFLKPNKVVGNSSATYTLTLDPNKKAKDRTIMETIIMKVYSNELKPYIKDDTSLEVEKGLYITLKITDKSEREKKDYQPKVISGFMGTLGIEPEIENNIAGMREKQTKEISTSDHKTYIIEIIGISKLNIPKTNLK